MFGVVLGIVFVRCICVGRACSIFLYSGIYFVLDIVVVVSVGICFVFASAMVVHSLGAVECIVWFGKVGGPAPFLLKNILVCQLPPGRWYLHIFLRFIVYFICFVLLGCPLYCRCVGFSVLLCSICMIYFLFPVRICVVVLLLPLWSSSLLGVALCVLPCLGLLI